MGTSGTQSCEGCPQIEAPASTTSAEIEYRKIINEKKNNLYEIHLLSS